MSSCWSYLISPAVPAVLVLRLDVEDVLHVQLEGLGAAGSQHARPLVHLEPPTGCNEGSYGSYGARINKIININIINILTVDCTYN